MLKIIDVSVPLSGDMTPYPGDAQFERTVDVTYGQDGLTTTSRLVMSAHSGTHVDAPRHFFPDGISVDKIPLEILLGKARVIEMLDLRHITRADLSRFDLRDDIRLLLKTRATGPSLSSMSRQEHVTLASDAARYVAQIGIKLLGVDTISVDSLDGSDFPSHRELLGAGVILIEGLDLTAVEPGEYEIICMPLPIRDGEAAPARVLLRSRR